MIKKFTLEYGISKDKVFKEGHILLCHIVEEFCPPTVRHPSILLWFPGTPCVVFEIASSLAKMQHGTNAIGICPIRFSTLVSVR